MTNAAFKLQDSGFTREQVEALTEFMAGSVATKEDIAHLEGKISSEIASLEGKIIALDGKIETQRQMLESKIIALDGKIIALNGKILYWMFGILVAGVASLVIKSFLG